MDSLKENQSRVVKRISRYGRVSTSVAGLATKLAGEKFLGIKIDADAHASQLAGAMGNLKGPLMKIGQITICYSWLIWWKNKFISPTVKSI